MQKIHGADYWRRLVSYGKYPLIFSFELAMGLGSANKATGFKTKLKNYCRFAGGSHISEEEAQSFASEMSALLKKNPKKVLEWKKDYDKHVKNFLAWLTKANKRASQNKLSKQELKRIYFLYEKDMERLWYWGYLPFLINEPIENEITNQLLQAGAKQKDIPQIIQTLNYTGQPTMHQREERESLSLAIKISENNKKNFEKQIVRHWKKWAWKKSWFYNQTAFSLEDLKGEIAELIKNGPEKVLKEKDLDNKEKLSKRKELLKKLKNKKIDLLAEILAVTTLSHTLKVEDVTYAVYLVNPIFKQLAEKFNLSPAQFIELIPREVKKEKFKLSEINERVRDCGILVIENKVIPLSGQKLEEVKSKVSRLPEKTDLLKGFPVYPGKVTGRVLLVSEKQNMSRVAVNPDCILVTSMTTTNMNPLISKVKAIITNEGGILCHAAIIAREFKKPCIVGTKIATQVLKDGDLVEVDANKGIVKKL